MEINRRDGISIKNMERIDKMLGKGYSIPAISSTLQIPTWKIIDVLQKRFAQAKREEEKERKKESQ